MYFECTMKTLFFDLLLTISVLFSHTQHLHNYILSITLLHFNWNLRKTFVFLYFLAFLIIEEKIVVRNKFLFGVNFIVVKIFAGKLLTIDY